MTEEDLISEFDLPDRHCISCHEDEGLGYDMLYLKLRDGRGLWVCCEVYDNYLDRQTKGGNYADRERNSRGDSD
jgi:hypothetical protein